MTNTTIAIAWLLRHPAKMQPVTGTMNVGRLKDCRMSRTLVLLSSLSLFAAVSYEAILRVKHQWITKTRQKPVLAAHITIAASGFVTFYKDCIAAADVHLTREQWYRIYTAAGNKLP